MSILIGAVLTAATIMIHALGTVAWTLRLTRMRAVDAHRTKRMVVILSNTALVLLFLQIMEVLLWAITWLMLPQVKELNTLEEALYFSMVTFTSLGYGDIVVAGHWRLLSGIQAMNGLLIFGWSTALLFAVVSRMLNRRLEKEAEASNG